MPYNHDNLIKEISILGKDARLSLTQRQAIRDRLFKKIGQSSLLDAVQTQTEVTDLVMPLNQIQRLFSPKRIVFSLPATTGVVASVFVATFATGAMAQSARPGDPLFGVRKAFENVRIAMISDPSEKAALQLNIVNDRIRALETADSKQVPVILNESKKALASAQASISSLTGDKAGDLNAKLKTLIESQKATLTTISKDNVSNDEVKKTVLAMRNELDALLPSDKTTTGTSDADSDKDITAVVPVGSPVRTTFYGSLTTSYGAPALFENGKVYVLSGVSIDLIPYIGNQNVTVIGQLNGKTLIVSRLIINSQLIWENTPDENNNNLSRVEDDQNSSSR